MSENKSLGDFEVTVSGFPDYEFPGDEYTVRDRAERGTSDRLATEFLGPCLGIIGYDAEEDELNGAHLSSPTGSKVDSFLERYDVESVFVTGMNYGPDQLADFQDRNEFSEPRFGNILEQGPQEAYRAVAKSDNKEEIQLTALEDILVKRQDVETTLQESDTDYRAEWASGASMHSAVKASTQDEEIHVLHSNL